MRRALRMLCLLLLSTVLALQPVVAQSVLRDAETEALLNDAMRPLIVAAGLDPKNVKIVVIGDPEINAFVAGGQIVYIHSGLIEAATDLNQVQGVVAHELGHITGGHVISSGEGAKSAMAIQLLSLLLGAAAMAAGSGEAGMGVLSAGQQAAMGRYLSFSRTQESSADAAGVSFLNKAGISGKGMISFFGRLRQEEYRLSSSYNDEDPFFRTHPVSADRQATLEPDLKVSPAWDKPTPPDQEARFQRIRAKLIGFVDDPIVTMRKYPESDTTPPARYARAFAWHKSHYRQQAQGEIDKLLAAYPNDPYFLELKGQIQLESGDPKAALAPLRDAVAKSHNDPLISTTLGQALVATEDPANLAEAQKVLKVAVDRDPENPTAWFQLGMIYDQLGDPARARLATAESYYLQNQPKLAMANARAAMAGIPQGSRDYLRAQDIAMVSQTAIQKDKKHR